jgi:hypothetical protein
MSGKQPSFDDLRGVFILIVGVVGLVLAVYGLLRSNGLAAVMGMVFVVASIMGEGLSHFAIARGRLTMSSRARPTSRRR